MFIISLSLFGCSYEETYFERHKSIYDPKLNQYRCVNSSGDIMDMEPPCLSLTLSGRHAVQKKEKDCIDLGREPSTCKKEARDWLYSKMPKH